jgi:hypothetical protein
MSRDRSFGLDRSDCGYDFKLSSIEQNARRRAKWMLGGASLVSSTGEGLLSLHRDKHGSGFYFLVTADASAVIKFAIRYHAVTLLAGCSAVEVACWQSLLHGYSHQAKQTVLFDELLAQHDLIFSRTDLLPGASRFWSYNMTSARQRGHRGGLLTADGQLSYLDLYDTSGWHRSHGIEHEGTLPPQGCRFFLQR